MYTFPAGAEAKGMPRDVRATGNPTVHIVEGDDAVRRSLEMLCRGAQFDVSVYPTVESLLTATHPQPPGCIVADDHLPDMSALQMLHTLRDANIHLPIIILGGTSDVQTAVNMMRAGAFHFLEKPYLRRRLVESVSEAVERSLVGGPSSSIKIR